MKRLSQIIGESDTLPGEYEADARFQAKLFAALLCAGNPEPRVASNWIVSPGPSPIRQMLLKLHYEGSAGSGGEGAYVGYGKIEVDRVHDGIGEFLAQIPEDLSEHSVMWLAITREDGYTVSYVDGMAPDPKNPDGGMRRLSAIDNGRYAGRLRGWVKRRARQRLARLAGSG